MLALVFRGSALATIVALAGLGCTTAPLHLRPWLEVRTENFEILSPRPEAEVVELALNLELFRSVVAFVTGQSLPTTRTPPRVYALDRSSQRPFAFQSVGGYFIPSARQNKLILSGGRRRGQAEDILRHEYVHFLLHSRGRYAYPPWYDEGFAEFLSNVEVTPDGVNIGRPLRGRLRALDSGLHWGAYSGWLSVGDLMARRNFDGLTPIQINAFYTQSWALVHYLILGRKRGSPRAELTRYLEQLRSGASNDAAARQAFGMEAGALGYQLTQYIKTGHYTFVTVPLDRFQKGAEPTVRVLSAGEVASALGELSIAIERYEQAQVQYAAALAEAPEDARALAGLGGALAGQERWQDADRSFAKALSIEPEDAWVHLDYASYQHGRAKTEGNAENRAAFAARARRHYVASWKLDDSPAETYAGYGATFLLNGEDASRGRKTLEKAHRLLPSSPRIKLDLAKLYAKLGRRGDARELALVVSMWGHSQEQREEIRELLAKTEPQTK